jgi:hypothetical protein
MVCDAISAMTEFMVGALPSRSTIWIHACWAKNQH